MLSVTPEAKVFLSAWITVNELPAEHSVRLAPTEDDTAYQLRPDTQRPGDTLISDKGRALLLIDEHVAQALEGKILDAGEDTTTGEKRLTIS